MSYSTQDTIAHDPALTGRVAQAAAGEGVDGDPDSWTWAHRRAWAAAPGWDAAWESAEAADPGADHGANGAVITDGQILSQVQAMLTLPAP